MYFCTKNDVIYILFIFFIFSNLSYYFPFPIKEISTTKTVNNMSARE